MNHARIPYYLLAAIALMVCLIPLLPAQEDEEEAKGGERTRNYDPNTKVYCDALWMRVHAEDCPELILKEKKKTMTLEEADKAGWRIGESGQSGREHCCLQGYKRKFPKKDIPEDAPGIVQVLKSGTLKWHLVGCHRFTPMSDHRRMTLKEAKDAGCLICPHCIERGPSLTTISAEELKTLPSSKGFVPPEGWVPKPYSLDKLPPKEELEFLILETLSEHNGIQECKYEDPVATAEHFMCMRFFFPVNNWLAFYKAYRSTGDKRLLDKLLESARHYNKLSRDFPSVAQLKASDPEGLAFMYSMAVSARITLQLARKHSDQVNAKEIDEAEEFLKTIILVLKSVCEGNDALDPEMGIPKKLADDFRTRAFNRAMNGIGTISMATTALEDLQALKKTTEYQPQIARYRKVLQEYIKNYRSVGHLCTKIPGEPMFVYPYSTKSDHPRDVDGCKVYGRSEDIGHYGICLKGLMLIYEATPEVGIDDAFMTAVANAAHYCGTHKMKIGGKEGWSGHIQCPTAYKQGVKKEAHPYEDKAEGRYRAFVSMEAFRDGLIADLAKTKMIDANKADTPYTQYLKALRKDRSLIHLGEEK
jgi:hypothetical protein